MVIKKGEVLVGFEMVRCFLVVLFFIFLIGVFLYLLLMNKVFSLLYKWVFINWYDWFGCYDFL